MDPRELSRALLLFDKINPVAAAEVMKGWRRDWKYQEAVERVAEGRRPPPANEPDTD